VLRSRLECVLSTTLLPASTATENVVADGDEPRLSRPGPPPTGVTDIEKGIDAWRLRVTPIVTNIAGMFGFQGGDTPTAGNHALVRSTRELVIDRMVGPGGCCLSRHRMPLNSRSESLKCVSMI